MQHIGAISEPLRLKIERIGHHLKAMDRERIAAGVERHGWPPNATCSLCGDTGLIPDLSLPEKPYYCDCDAGISAEKNLSLLAEETAWNQAGIPYRGTEFRIDAAPDKTAADRVRHWLNRDPMRLGAGLILGGAVGVGKTGLAVGAMRELVFSGKSRSPHFVGCDDLFRSLQESMDRSDDRKGDERSEGYSTIIRRCQRADLLLIDDLGQTRETPWRTEVIEEIIGKRNEDKRPTIVTTNLDLDDLRANVGGRSFSRLKDDATIVAVTGADRRVLAS